jgi:hypothetical protein
MRERDHLEDPGVNGRKIIKRILRKWDGKALTGLIWHLINDIMIAPRIIGIVRKKFSGVLASMLFLVMCECP